MTTPSYVGLHIPGTYSDAPGGPFIDERLTAWGRAELIEELLHRELPVFVSRGAEAFRHYEGMVDGVEVRGTRRHEGNLSVEVQAKRIPIQSLSVIRNVASVIGHGVPELNAPTVRAITRDKLSTNDLLAELHLAKEYKGWKPGEPIDDALDAIHSNEVVIKPVHGRLSRGIVLGTKAAVAIYAKSLPKEEGQFVIEERVHTKPLEGIRGRDREQQDIINAVRKAGIPSELRAFTFGRNRYQDHFVLRVGAPGDQTLANCTRVYIDQESVPEDVRRLTADVKTAMRRAADVKEVHLGIDWVRLANGLIAPMEINSGEPQLVYETDDPETAGQHVQFVCRQLQRAIHNGI